MELKQCRQRLDEIDEQIVELLNERMKVCEKVAEAKLSRGRAVYDPDREAQKLEAVGAMAETPEKSVFIQAIFSKIMETSRELQQQLIDERGSE